MSHLTRSRLFFTIVSLISLAQAQFVTRRRSSLGRIVGGCVVGALVLIFLLCFCLMMMRRRRSRMMGGTPQNSHFVGKPLFGGPWGRSGAGAGNGAYGAGPTSAYGNNNNLNNANQGQAPQAPYNPEYPPQNAAAPPPAYGNVTGQETKYGAPAESQSNGQTGYAAPPGAPPQAHTKGEDNTFVGGFRQ